MTDEERVDAYVRDELHERGRTFDDEVHQWGSARSEPRDLSWIFEAGYDRDGVLLEEALEITTGARAEHYGHASVNLGRTAKLIDAYLDGIDRPLTPGDVAAIMICVKMARLHQSPDHYDSLLDIAGYASSAWDAVTGPDRPTYEV
jgi:hypothetical protein